MKRKIKNAASILMTIFILTNLMLWPFSVYATDPLSLTVSDVTGDPGTDITVSINISADSGLGGATFLFTYDNTKLAYKSMNTGAVFKGLNMPNETYKTEGDFSTIKDVLVYWSNIPGALLMDAGSLLDITFTILPGWSGSTQLVLSAETYGDEISIPCVVQNGSVNVPPQFHTMTFNANGGTGGSSGLMQSGTVLTAPTVTKTGYTLIGWQPSLPANVPFIDAIYTAQWAANHYTVVYDGNGSTGGSTASSTHTYDTERALTGNGFIKSGYTFVGWSTSKGGPAVYADYQKVRNLTAENNGTVTLYAAWLSASIDIVAKNGSTTVVNQSNHFIYGLKPGITKTQFESDYVQLEGNIRLGYSAASDTLGTGTIVKLIDIETNAVLKSYTVVIFGDMDGDGFITAGDENPITMAASYQTAFDDGSALKFAADVNKDGNVDLFDLNIIRAAISGLGSIDQA